MNPINKKLGRGEPLTTEYSKGLRVLRVEVVGVVGKPSRRLRVVAEIEDPKTTTVVFAITAKSRGVVFKFITDGETAWAIVHSSDVPRGFADIAKHEYWAEGYWHYVTGLPKSVIQKAITKFIEI